MQASAVSKLGLEDELRTAIEAGELRLHYQPFMCAEKNSVLGVEALLRWAHPDHGIMGASEFLPVAEEGRLMADIAKWMCSQIHRDIAMWNAYGVPPMTVAVNLSLSQLDSADLHSWLAPLTKSDFLGEHKLAVEIPEEALSSLNQSRFIALAVLIKMGIDLHLDHFGRGSFSLAALHSLPFSLLKLDMSLISAMSNEVSGDVLIGAAIMLAHQLGMKAGAVGVETPWQAQALKAQRCDALQGFLAVSPMTAEELSDWLQKKPAR
jgi:EAL domain-containing protein (putative c-di-GMP-specific phosphodiesterase class I)